MTKTAPVIETSNESGHMIFNITVGGEVVAYRYMHILTGRHYVRDLRTTAPPMVDGTLDARAAQVAFMRIYRELAAL